MEARSYRPADVDDDADFQFFRVGAGKALKVSDDELSVNYSEIRGLQCGDCMMVLVRHGKS